MRFYTFILVLHFLDVCFCYPEFRNDYTITAVPWEDPISEAIAQTLAPVDEEMPAPCRNDMCYSDVINNMYKGRFYWPYTPIGHKVKLRCPFSFDTPVYSSRECGLSKDNTTTWGLADYRQICPDAPLTELLKKIEKELNEKASVTNKTAMYTNILTRMVNVITYYRDTPMNSSKNFNLLLDIYSEVVVYLTEDQVSLDVASDIIYIFNTLMDEDMKKQTLIKLYMKEELVISLLEKLPHKIERNIGQTLELILTNMAMYVIDISKEMRHIKITDGYRQPLLTGDDVYTPNVSLYFNNLTKYFAGDTFTIAVIIIKDPTIKVANYLWYQYTEYTVEVPVTIDKIQYSTASYNHFTFNSTPISDDEVSSPGLEQNNRSISQELTTSLSSSKAILTSDFNDSVSQKSNKFKTITVKKRMYRFAHVGNSIFFSSSINNSAQVLDEVVTISYNFYTCENRTNCYPELSCVKGSSEDGYTEWSNQGCTTVDNQVDHGYITCSCRGPGSFGVFGPNMKTITPPDSKGLGDVSVFLGFPYREELEILGNVLGSVSLAGLIATITSYVIFRRKNLSTPAKILLNLCVALIALSVLLFGIYFASGVMNITGCTVSNTLRYYFIFVSLVWNGAEALNMYMMLVKVFGGDISKFVVKAGMIAWGLPALMVCVCFSVSKRSFDGEYVLVSELYKTCSFKCQLRSGTLYYGYLLPLGIIITHNLVMFGFVFQAILRHGSQLGKAQKKSKLVQLSGAVATLVLLGIPWIFSAFGAIDATTSEHLARTEGVFQVIFVVFVNLQGLFIFLFHCARNTQMRASWSSVMKRSTFRSTKSTSSALSNSNTESQSRKTSKSSLETSNKDVDKEFDRI